MLHPKTILVYTGIDLIGDAMFKLPFVRHLRVCYPDAHITWVAGKGHSVYARAAAPLVQGILDEVLECAEIGQSLQEIFAPRPFSGRSFDLVIDTQERTLTAFVLKRIRHRCFVSGAAHFLFSDIRPPRWPFNAAKPRSISSRLRFLGKLITGIPISSSLDIQVDPLTEAEAHRLLPLGHVYIGFAPGAGGRHKCWPLDRFIAAAVAQVAHGRIPVFLLGPSEAEWSAKIRAAVPQALLPLQETDHNVTPILTIALAQGLNVAVANDSGIGHLIAAADVPLVSLFGPTPSEKFAPAVSQAVVLHAQGWGCEAIEGIPTKAVLTAIEELLQPATDSHGD